MLPVMSITKNLPRIVILGCCIQFMLQAEFFLNDNFKILKARTRRCCSEKNSVIVLGSSCFLPCTQCIVGIQCIVGCEGSYSYSCFLLSKNPYSCFLHSDHVSYYFQNKEDPLDTRRKDRKISSSFSRIQKIIREQAK